MAHNHIIAIGGTGARHLKAFVCLAAAGLTEGTPLSLLLIDADQNNGNGTKVNQLIANYNALNQLAQPGNHRRRGRLSRWRRELSPPVIFRSQLNRGQIMDVRWQNPNKPDLKFAQ